MKSFLRKPRSSSALKALGVTAVVPVIMLAGLSSASATEHGVFHVRFDQGSLVCNGDEAVSINGSYTNTTDVDWFALGTRFTGRPAFQWPRLNSGDTHTNVYNLADLGVSPTTRVFTLKVMGDDPSGTYTEQPGENSWYNTCLNNAPVAHPYSGTAYSGVRARFNVLDKASAGAVLNAITSQPAQARARITSWSGGAISVITKPDFTGQLVIGYDVQNPHTGKVSKPTTLTIDVTSTAHAPVATLTAAPNTITEGSCTYLYSRAGYGQSATKGGEWSGSLHLNRHREQVCPSGAGDHTYSITVNGEGGSVTTSEVVTVTAAPPTPKVVSHQSPTTVQLSHKAPVTVTHVVIKPVPAHQPAAPPTKPVTPVTVAPTPVLNGSKHEGKHHKISITSDLPVVRVKAPVVASVAPTPTVS